MFRWLIMLTSFESVATILHYRSISVSEICNAGLANWIVSLKNCKISDQVTTEHACFLHWPMLASLMKTTLFLTFYPCIFRINVFLMSVWFLICSLNHGIQVGVGINFLWRRNHWSQTRPLIVIEQKKVITNSKQELKNRDPRSKDLPSRVSWVFEICIYTRCCKAFHAVVISGLVFHFLLLCRGCVKYELPKTTACEAGCCLPIKEKVKNVFHDSVFCSVPPTCLKSENWQREAGEKCIVMHSVVWQISPRAIRLGPWSVSAKHFQCLI